MSPEKRLQELIRRGEESRIKGEQALRETSDNFNNKRRAFMKKLLKSDLVSLLSEYDIPVNKTLSLIPCFRLDGIPAREFELVAINDDEVVVVEVRTALRLKDVDDLLAQLQDFKRIVPEYADRKIYGAVAYLEAEADAVEYAKKKELFVIQSSEGNAGTSTILNPKDFKPRAF